MIFLLFGYYLMTIPEPVGPLIINLDGVLYSDDVFTADFNYSARVGKRITFFEPLNYSELYEESFSFEVESLFEVWPLLDRLRMPNVVRGLARILLNGTYEGAKRFFARDGKSGIQLYLGDVPGGGNRPAGVWYVLQRFPATSNTVEEIFIAKEYSTGRSWRSNWGLYIRVYQSPPLKVSFRRSASHWMP